MVEARELMIRKQHERIRNRDRKLVDVSAYRISYCHREIGETVYTVRYAMEQEIPVLNTSSWDLR